MRVPGAITVVDKDGFARSSYLVDDDEEVTVAVRPDLFIGAIVQDAAGLERYFDKFLKT